MNAARISELAAVTLDGSMPFPEIVGHLLDQGVEAYLVDYRALRFTFYGADGGIVVAPLTFEGLPEVAEDFDQSSLLAAIHDSQTRGQKYRDFCRRAMLAGVQSYFAFLRGKRVTYLGRQGDQHTEWFPGAAAPTAD
jgi:uncharacterized protein YbcV (DUF1398 family)